MRNLNICLRKLANESGGHQGTIGLLQLLPVMDGVSIQKDQSKPGFKWHFE